MSNVISNVVNSNQSEYNQIKKDKQQENFGAIDVNSIKEDTVELAQRTGDQIKENWLFRMLRNTFGVKDPKKFTISAVLTLGTVIGCAFLGNKMSDKTAELGLAVDEKILGKGKDSIFAKMGTSIKNAKNSVIEWLKKRSKTAQDLFDTMKKRMAKPKADLTRGYGRGFVSIFSLTPVDVLHKTFAKQAAAYKKAAGNPEAQKKIVEEITKSVSKLVGEKNAGTFVENILGTATKKLENRELCSMFSKAMRENFGVASNKDFLSLLKALKSGVIERNGNKIDVSEFTKVTMKEGGLTGLISSWWPVNIIRRICSVFKKDTTIGLGNLGDSLIKFNAVNGTLADTKVGQLVQKSITVPTESISNFVNDKSGLGVFLCSSVMSTYNNMQDAPKGEKVATVADNFVGTIGSIAIATPLAFKTTYGLASLKNLEGKSIFSKALKGIGKIFGMGLDTIKADGTRIANTSKLKGFAGGALRFALIMFVFNSMFSKPINKLIHKVFGTPGAKKAKEEAEKAKALAEQQAKAQLKNIVNTNNSQQTKPVQYVANPETNLLNKWTQLPAGANQSNAAAPISGNNYAQPVKPKNNDEIAAFNLFKKDKKEDRYTPSIEPVIIEQQDDPQLNAQIEELMKRSELVMNNSKKLL